MLRGRRSSSSHTTVRVVELHGPGSVRAAERAVPSDGALLQVETTGVCGTDHHIYAGRLSVPTPQLLGHEVIGRLMRLPDEHGLVGRRRSPGSATACSSRPACRAATARAARAPTAASIARATASR